MPPVPGDQAVPETLPGGGAGQRGGPDARLLSRGSPGAGRGSHARAAYHGRQPLTPTLRPPIIVPVKIYTRTGDSGETGLFDGTRVLKSDSRVEAYGEVDELNALLGVIRAAGVDAELGARLEQIQRDLFALGARLADPRAKIAARVAKASLEALDAARLERWIDEADAVLPALRRFLLPGGAPAGALLHLARTVCRRAERRIVALGPDAVDAAVIVYMNRLSDLLFVLARVANARAAVPELEW